MSTGPLFKFAGEEFPVPTLTTLGFNEAMVVNRVCRCDGAQFAVHAEKGDETFIAGLLAVGLHRLHPDWAFDEIARLVGQADMGSFDVLRAEVAETEVPPAVEKSSSGDSPVLEDSASAYTELPA